MPGYLGAAAVGAWLKGSWNKLFGKKTPPPEEPPPGDPWPTCPCINAPGVNNFCHYGPSYAGCPMTAPGGYCDPNGDGSFAEGNWDQGWYDWQAQCT